jgi:hypothetical protein
VMGCCSTGSSRYRACLELAIEPDVSLYKGTDPLGFVIGKNLHRRHLNESQRALAAAQVADMKRGGARGEAQGCALTHAQVAAKFGVSPRQVDTASALLNAVEGGRAIPELLESVRSGERRLHYAERLCTFPVEEQREALARGGRRPAARRKERTRRRLRQFREAVRDLEECLLMLVTNASDAGGLTVECRGQLVASCRDAYGKLGDLIRKIEEPNTEHLPFYEA